MARLKGSKDKKLRVVRKRGPYVQFCKYGHDTFECGRASNRRCKECLRYFIKLYRQTHKEKINEDDKKRKKVNINFRISCILRSRLRAAIKNNQKVGSAVQDLGCSIDFLITYIQKKFYGGMTWSNWGTYWELDHIKALMFFDLTKRKQFLKACNYTNLQPLSIEDHKKKTIKEMLIWKKRKSY